MNLSNAFLGPFILLIFATSCSNEFYNKRTFFLFSLLPIPSPDLMCDDFVGHPSSYILRNSGYWFFTCFLWIFCDFFRPLWQSQTSPEWRILISPCKEAALHFLQFLLSFFNVFSSFAVFFFRWYNHNFINAQLVHGELQ